MNNGNMMPAGKDRPQRTVTRVPLIAPLPRRKKVAAYARVSVEKDASLAGYARVSTDSDEQENSYVYCIQTAGHTNVLVPEYGYRTAVLYGWTGRELVFADAMWRILIFLCIYIFMLVLCAKWNTIILDISNQFAY